MYRRENGLPSNQIRALLHTRILDQDAIWTGTDGGGLARYQEGHWSIYNPSRGLPNYRIDSLHETITAGGVHTLWIGLAAAGLVAMFVAYPRAHKWDTGISINGFLAGLVAITCPCYWVSPFGSICIGAVAGVVVILGIDLLEYLRIDDPIGAVPVHGVCGIWGTVSLGLFACGQYGATGPLGPDNSAPLKGLFYGGGMQVLKAQLIGSACITLATFSVAMVVMWVVNAMGMLRLPAEMEAYGMDLHEHGISAYPEYVISALGAPAGMSQELPAAQVKAGTVGSLSRAAS